MHRFKAGVQYDRHALTEHFRMTGKGDDLDAAAFDPCRGGVPVVFDGSRTGQTVGLFVQDTLTPLPDLHVSLGLRYDRYRLLIEDSAVSPRVGIAYHFHDAGTVFRASYRRIFVPPFSENLLPSSSPRARAPSPNRDIGGGEDVRPERPNAYEVGVQQALGGRPKIDVAY